MIVGCYLGDIWMLLGCSLDFTLVVVGCYLDDTWMLLGCYLDVFCMTLVPLV